MARHQNPGHNRKHPFSALVHYGRLTDSFFLRHSLLGAYNLAQNSGETVAGRIENLRPWSKGVSGNPGGRPKKLKLDEILVELLEKDEGADALAMGEALVRKAKRGDLRAFQLIAERTQGKPRQSVAVDAKAALTLSERFRQAEERLEATRKEQEAKDIR